MVKNHSIALNCGPYRREIPATLSRMTIVTLRRIATSSAISKALPAGVSCSKMTRYSRWRIAFSMTHSGPGS
jgi:hypothetical protein